MFGAIAGGIAFVFAGGALSKLFGSGQKAASGGIQGAVLSTDNTTLGMGDGVIKSALQGSNVPNRDEAVPSFVSGAMAKAGKGLLEGTLQAGTSAVSDKFFFFQAEDGIRDYKVTGVQTCALPICPAYRKDLSFAGLRLKPDADQRLEFVTAGRLRFRRRRLEKRRVGKEWRSWWAPDH